MTNAMQGRHLSFEMMVCKYSKQKEYAIFQNVSYYVKVYNLDAIDAEFQVQYRYLK